MSLEILATLVILAAQPAARAVPRGYDAARAEAGAPLYAAHCMTCHGKDGAGDGPQAAAQKVAPADLTLLSRANRGKFPFDRVRRTIDGRGRVSAHQESGMPMWGDALLSARDGYDAAAVRLKIDQLTHYLASLQKN